MNPPPRPEGRDPLTPASEVTRRSTPVAASTLGPAPVVLPGDLRPGLRRLANGLVAYGVIGLIVTLLGLVAFGWVGGRIGELSDRAATRVGQVADTLDSTAQALTDASDSARTFAVTLTTTVSAVDSAGSRVRELQPTLADLESQFRSIDIFGTQPLGRAADVVASIHATLDGLDGQLDAVADSLRNGHDRLVANGSSLAVLGAKIGTLADDLRSGIVEDSLSDVRTIVTVIMLVLAIWTAVPAVGALFVGAWLRRNLMPAI